MPCDCPRCCGLNPKSITRPLPSDVSTSALLWRMRFSPSSQPLINGLNAGYVAITAPPRVASKTGPDLKKSAISGANPYPIGCFVSIRARNKEPGQKNVCSPRSAALTTLTMPFSLSPKYSSGSSVARLRQMRLPPSSTNVSKFANPSVPIPPTYSGGNAPTGCPLRIEVALMSGKMIAS